MSTIVDIRHLKVKKQLYMERSQSEIVPEYNGSLSCGRHPNVMFGVVCGMLMNRRSNE